MAHAATASPASTVTDRILDAGRRVAHGSHQARLLKSVGADAIESGVYAARRAVKTATRDLVDACDDTAYRIKREPLKSVGVAFGAGVCLGIAAGATAWLFTHGLRRADT